MESHPSRVAMKRRLTESIDIPKYLSLDSKGRYDMVMQNVKELTNKLQVEKVEAQIERLEIKGTRKCDLIDITQL
jgi:hypothetical protein